MMLWSTFRLSKVSPSYTSLTEIKGVNRYMCRKMLGPCHVWGTCCAGKGFGTEATESHVTCTTVNFRWKNNKSKYNIDNGELHK